MFIINNILNEGIKVNKIRLIFDDKSDIIDTKEALKLAYKNNMDLVMISPNADPPVCKIIDYKKYLYEKTKKEKENKKKQIIIKIKEIRLSTTIDEHDINFKVNNAIKFIQHGDKVKVSLKFKGRENNNKDIGYKILENFISKIKDYVIIEKTVKLEGQTLTMILSPKK